MKSAVTEVSVTETRNIIYCMIASTDMLQQFWAQALTGFLAEWVKYTCKYMHIRNTVIVLNSSYVWTSNRKKWGRISIWDELTEGVNMAPSHYQREGKQEQRWHERGIREKEKKKWRENRQRSGEK